MCAWEILSVQVASGPPTVLGTEVHMEERDTSRNTKTSAVQRMQRTQVAFDTYRNESREGLYILGRYTF